VKLDDIRAMARPILVTLGCIVPPLIEFAQNSLWRFILIPWFVWSVGQWFKLYVKQKEQI
jgi:hypothetical protein